MHGVGLVYPAVETPTLRSDIMEGSSSGSRGGGSGGDNGGDSGSGNTGSGTPFAARAAALAPAARLAVAVDRQESASVLSSLRLPSWGSWGGFAGGGVSVAEGASGAGTASAEHGPPYHCQVLDRERERAEV